jgi:hypothetical protein
MANKSYATTMLLLRIGVLAVQIAMSPSAAVQYRDFLVGEGGRLVDFVRGLPYPQMTMILWEPRNGQGAHRKQTDSLPRAVKSSRDVLEDSKWEKQ